MVPFLRSDDDVVDRDVYQFDEETDKSHNAEPDGRGDGNLLELAPIGLGAALDQSDRVLGERTARFVDLGDLIHCLSVGGKMCY